MAPINRDALQRVAAMLTSKSVASLPDPLALGLSPTLPAALAAHAAAAGGDRVSAHALGALPPVGGGTVATRLGTLGDGVLTRTRDRVFGETGLVGGGVPVTLIAASDAATSQAAVNAKAQAAAILVAVRARLAAGPADPAAIASVIGSVVPPAALAPSQFANSLAQASTREPERAATPAEDQMSGKGDRWGAIRDRPADASPDPRASGAVSPAASPAQRWRSFAKASNAISANDALAASTMTGQAITAGSTDRWQSLRVATPSPDPAASLQQRALAASEPAPQAGPIAPPPCDGAALSSLASTASLFRAGFGYGLEAPGAISTLAETMASFNQATADLPPIAPATLAVLSAWGSLARGVGAVRDQMGVDLLEPDAGQAMSAAIVAGARTGSVGPTVWQEDRARSVMAWLSLDQAASALQMPTAGPRALAKLGSSLRGLAVAPAPSCQDPVAAVVLMSALDNVRIIRDSLGVDVLSAGAGDQLRSVGRRMRNNLAGSTTPMASAAVPSTAMGLTYSALARFARIDRTQAGDLGLGELRADGGPVMTSAPLVLGTLAAARDALVLDDTARDPSFREVGRAPDDALLER